MQNIIALCGKKGSGKNTLCNFLHGYQLKSLGIINNFYLDDNGGLVINLNVVDENEVQQAADISIDVTRTDIDFGEWASYNMWPYIKHYSFAHSLKEIGENLFDIPRENLFGTEDQKNQIMPHLLWENMPGIVTPSQVKEYSEYETSSGFNLYCEIEKKSRDEQNASYWDDNINKPNILNNRKWILNTIIHEPGPMTAREFMQFFGTEIMRKMYEPLWTNRTIKDIESEEPLIAVISDCRFKNEAKALKAKGAKLVYLTRSISNNDNHLSENGFGDFNDFDLTIDNANMTLLDTCKALLDGIHSWDWFEKPKEKVGIKKIKAEK